MKSEDILMNPEYRRKTKRIRIAELSCLSLAGVSVAALIALLTLRIN